MHAATAQLALQPETGSPPSKLNLVSLPGNSPLKGSPAGSRIPAGQSRKWLRIDANGKSAFIKVQAGTHMITLNNCLPWHCKANSVLHRSKNIS